MTVRCHRQIFRGIKRDITGLAVPFCSFDTPKSGERTYEASTCFNRHRVATGETARNTLQARGWRRALNHPARIRLISAARKIVAYAKAHGFWSRDRPSPFADIDFAGGFAKQRKSTAPRSLIPSSSVTCSGRSPSMRAGSIDETALSATDPSSLANHTLLLFSLYSSHDNSKSNYAIAMFASDDGRFKTMTLSSGGRRIVSEGVSPKNARYATEKRPNSQKP